MHLKHLKYMFVSLCLVLLCLYLVRSPISVRIANHFLAPLNAQVTCLSWSLHSWRTIQIEQLCINTEQGDARVTNALLSRDNLFIAQLDVKPKVAQQQKQSKQAFKPLSLVLPQRPTLNITRLNIAKTPYTPPLALSVQETKLNHFSVTGDIKAAIALASSEINARLDASSPLVQSQLPQLISSLSGHAEIQFYGDKLQANIAHTLQAQVQYQACEVRLDSTGASTLFFDLNTQVAQVDMAKPTNTLSPSGCGSLLPEAHREALEVLLTKPVNIQFAQPLQFDDGLLKTTNVNVTSLDELTQLQISNIRFEPATLSLSSDVTFKHQGAHLGSLLWQGSVNYQNKQLLSEGAFEHSAQHMGLLPMKHQGISLSGKTLLSQLAGDVTFNYQGLGRVDSLSHDAFEGEELQFDIDANMTLSDELQGDVNLDVLLDSAQFQDVALKQAKAHVVAVLDTEQQLTLESNLQVAMLAHPHVSISGVNSNYQFKADVGAGEVFVDIVGQTTLAKLKTPQLTLSNLTIDSKGQQNRGGRFEHVIQELGFSGLFTHQYSPIHHAFEFNLTSDNVTELQPLVSQLNPKLKLVQGQLSLHSHGDLNLRTADFESQVKNLSLLYDTHYIDDIDTHIVGTFDSGKVNIPDSTVTVGQVRSGVVLSQLKTHLQVEANQAYLSQSHAKVFDGSIDVPMIKLSTEPQVIDVQAQALDLAEIAQAGRDAGIELTGRVSGKFPIKLEDMQMSIEQGQLVNSGIGQLKVAQNASIEALKAQQPSLESVIGVLDNLTIDNLTSDVALSPDGWLTLGVKIVGENKAQAQPVNFNYTHQENVFILFRALRLSDELTQKVEDALTK